jgi:hypothetical protein
VPRAKFTLSVEKHLLLSRGIVRFNPGIEPFFRFGSQVTERSCTRINHNIASFAILPQVNSPIALRISDFMDARNCRFYSLFETGTQGVVCAKPFCGIVLR